MSNHMTQKEQDSKYFTENRLPLGYIKQMKEMLGKEYDEYLMSFEKPRYFGLRANELKILPEHLKDILPFSVEKIPWSTNGYYYDEEVQPAKSPYYHAGLYYIQEPTAMVPATVLPVEKGDRVLDLCAAPGGKSTQLGAKLDGTGLLVCNDISSSRAKGLVKNIELFGIKNAIVMSESPEKLETYFENFFDKILIDAPCSGEGMFRKDFSMVKSWEERGHSYYVDLQKQILTSAVKMLKSNGQLLYSTCTYSTEENEKIIQWFLDTFSDFVLCDIPPNSNFSEGIGDGSLKKTVRLWPHKVKGEGHFVALLQKQGKKDVLQNDNFEASGEYNSIDQKKYEIYRNFEKEYLNIELNKESLIVVQDKLYHLPKGTPSLKGLRLLKTGWYLGDFKKDRFEPSQAFASGLKDHEIKNIIRLSEDQVEVIKYLKGETLPIIANKGYHVVCVKQYPLGWAKSSGKQLKNKYNPGWRWM